MISTQLNSGFLFSMGGGLTLIILFMTLAIFGWFAIRYRNIRNFEFQISLFIVIYIIGEILEVYGIPSLGSQIHLTAAVFLATIIWLRLHYVRKSGRKMTDKIESMEEGNVNGAT
jgi:hypothetical protein